MKKLIFILLLLPALAYSQWVTDSLGNRLKLEDWTLFSSVEKPFYHPNGNWYPDKQTGGICWVYTTRYHFHRFQGWLTIFGLTWGAVDAYQDDYFDQWHNWDNVWTFNAKLIGGWLWGHCLDSSNPYACRDAGTITGSVWAISQAHNFDLSWQRGPTWSQTGIMVGELVSPILLGWALDKIRHIPSQKPAYRYKIQCQR